MHLLVQSVLWMLGCKEKKIKVWRTEQQRAVNHRGVGDWHLILRRAARDGLSQGSNWAALTVQILLYRDQDASAVISITQCHTNAPKTLPNVANCVSQSPLRAISDHFRVLAGALLYSLSVAIIARVSQSLSDWEVQPLKALPSTLQNSSKVSVVCRWVRCTATGHSGGGGVNQEGLLKSMRLL